MSNNNQHFRLAEFFIPSYGPPCFAIPIFVRNKKLFIQKTDEDGFIYKFWPPTALSERQKERIIKHPSSKIAKMVGDTALAAFAITEAKIVNSHQHDLKKEIKDFLERDPSIIESKPFLSMEAAAYAGDAEILRAAIKSAERLLEKQDCSDIEGELESYKNDLRKIEANQ